MILGTPKSWGKGSERIGRYSTWKESKIQLWKTVLPAFQHLEDPKSSSSWMKLQHKPFLTRAVTEQSHTSIASHKIFLVVFVIS